jgi:YhcH/YjgK/YiaL family protein
MIVCPWKDLNRYAPIIPGLAEAIEAVAAIDDWTPRTIPLSDGNKILVQEGTTKDAATQLIEAHRNYLDIQYIVEGMETVGWAPIEKLTPAGEYNAVKDKIMYAGHVDFMDIVAGHCYVVYPEDGHMPGVHLEAPQHYRKLVVKLKV